MAHRTFYVTRDQWHPLYKTRMLTAGQEITLSASAARLFNQLGAELSEDAPKRAAPKAEPKPEPIPTVDEVLTAEVAVDAPKPAAKKAAPKRRRKSSK